MHYSLTSVLATPPSGLVPVESDDFSLVRSLSTLLVKNQASTGVNPAVGESRRSGICSAQSGPHWGKPGGGHMLYNLTTANWRMHPGN
jgi:hypothetical protein